MGRLIGITGLAGSGKDTAAGALVEIGFRRDAFADRMRTAILALDPIVSCSSQTQGGYEPGWRLAELVEAHGWDYAKREHPEVRRLLQKFGTEAGRDIHGSNCWVNLVLEPWLTAGVMQTLTRDVVRQDDLVITDVRFENEAIAVKNAGGIVLQIVRPGLEQLAGGHSSEAGFAEHYIDARIVNEGTVPELYAAVLTVARHFYPEGN